MEDPLTSRNILWITPKKIEKLFERIGPVIQKENTYMRMTLPARTELEIRLWFLATRFLKF